MDFSLLATDTASNARAGLISTAHGEIETPIFMPVGTVGSVKGVHFRELEEDIKIFINDRSIKQVDLMDKYGISRNTLKKYVEIVKAAAAE